MLSFQFRRLHQLTQTVFLNKNDPDLIESKKEQLDEQLTKFKKHFTKSFDKII
jgi:hypothetical protein